MTTDGLFVPSELLLHLDLHGMSSENPREAIIKQSSSSDTSKRV